MAGGSSTSEYASFVEQFGLGGMPHLTDDSLWARFGVSAQPAWLFVNQDGRSRLLVTMLGADRLESEIENLLSQ
ncbi:MAG: hypothetical protein JJLCMIEE_03213 [Acidimicrobiales bacterium]|nr:hypothetical protein [Acidimicrobiales bacterium]